MRQNLSPIYKLSIKITLAALCLWGLIIYTDPLNLLDDNQIRSKTRNNIYQGVFNRLFPGKWTNMNQNSKPEDLLQFLGNKDGPFYTKFNKLDLAARYQAAYEMQPLPISDSTVEVTNVTIVAFLFKSEYFNEERMKIKLNDGIWYPQNSTLRFDGTTNAQVNLESSMDSFQESKLCPLTCNFIIGPVKGESGSAFGLETLDFLNDGNSNIDMSLQSKDESQCVLNMNAKLQIRSWVDKSQILGYLVLSICALSISMIATKSLIRKLIEDTEYCKFYSYSIVPTLIGLDLYFCFNHVLISMNSGVIYFFYSFIAVTLCFFTLFSGEDVTLLKIIVNQHLSLHSQNDTPEQLRNRIYYFNVKIVFLIVGNFILLMYYTNSQIQALVIFLMGLSLTPQIYLNVKNDNPLTPRFDELTCIFISKIMLFVQIYPVTSLIFQAYLSGYPDNVLKLRPSTTWTIVMLLVFSSTVYILHGQYRYGPDFFLPGFLKPDKYNYLVPIKKTKKEVPKETFTELSTSDQETSIMSVSMNTSDQDEEALDVSIKKWRFNQQKTCAICMSSVEDILLEEPTDTHNALYERFKRYNNSHYMKTPCGHEFHIPCLLGWMRMQMKCPTCRGALPKLKQNLSDVALFKCLLHKPSSYYLPKYYNYQTHPSFIQMLNSAVPQLLNYIFVNL